MKSQWLLTSSSVHETKQPHPQSQTQPQPQPQQLIPSLSQGLSTLYDHQTRTLNLSRLRLNDEQLQWLIREVILACLFSPSRTPAMSAISQATKVDLSYNMLRGIRSVKNLFVLPHIEQMDISCCPLLPDSVTKQCETPKALPEMLLLPR